MKPWIPLPWSRIFCHIKKSYSTKKGKKARGIFIPTQIDNIFSFLFYILSERKPKCITFFCVHNNAFFQLRHSIPYTYFLFFLCLSWFGKWNKELDSWIIDFFCRKIGSHGGNLWFEWKCDFQIKFEMQSKSNYVRVSSQASKLKNWGEEWFPVAISCVYFSLFLNNNLQLQNL